MSNKTNEELQNELLELEIIEKKRNMKHMEEVKNEKIKYMKRQKMFLLFPVAIITFMLGFVIIHSH